MPDIEGPQSLRGLPRSCMKGASLLGSRFSVAPLGQAGGEKNGARQSAQRLRLECPGQQRRRARRFPEKYDHDDW